MENSKFEIKLRNGYPKANSRVSPIKSFEFLISNFEFNQHFLSARFAPGNCSWSKLTQPLPYAIIMSWFNGETILQIAIGSVWVFHGFYSKLLNGIPRHRLIVGKVLGDQIAGPATKTIGCLEVLLGLWAFSGLVRVDCAVVQTLAIVSMNALEIAFARSLLISAPGMVILNLAFLAAIWRWALFS